MERVGLVGVGAMGTALLERLRLAGVQPIAFDIDPAAVARARNLGADIAGSIPELARVATGNLGAGSHPLDEIISRDGKFLHVLVDGTHTVGTFRIGHDGGLTWIGAAGTLPPGDVGLATS